MRPIEASAFLMAGLMMNENITILPPLPIRLSLHHHYHTVCECLSPGTRQSDFSSTCD